jgi:hypothetical protein
VLSSENDSSQYKVKGLGCSSAREHLPGVLEAFGFILDAEKKIVQSEAGYGILL